MSLELLPSNQRARCRGRRSGRARPAAAAAAAAVASARSRCRSQIAVSKKKRAVTSCRLSGSVRMNSRQAGLRVKSSGVERDADLPGSSDDAGRSRPGACRFGARSTCALSAGQIERQPGELVLRAERVGDGGTRSPAAADENDGRAVLLALRELDEARDVVDELAGRARTALRPAADARAAPVGQVDAYPRRASSAAVSMYQPPWLWIPCR